MGVTDIIFGWATMYSKPPESFTNRTAINHRNPSIPCAGTGYAYIRVNL